jgi:cytochrome c oxidase cbb3-type subunit 3
MIRRALLACTAAGLLLGCEREERQNRPDPVASETHETIAQSPLSPGPGDPERRTSGKGEKTEASAFQVSEGKRLYAWMNCNGCHFNGGGGIGPALMDDQWIYGAEIENIVQTIKEGRPNGMPSYRGKIPEDQIWQIAAYVRSMSGLLPKDVAPSRNDDISARPAESRTPPQPPRGAVTPGAAQQSQ